MKFRVWMMLAAILTVGLVGCSVPDNSDGPCWLGCPEESSAAPDMGSTPQVPEIAVPQPEPDHGVEGNTVVEWRFPVKDLTGQELPYALSLLVTSNGIYGDGSTYMRPDGTVEVGRDPIPFWRSDDPLPLVIDLSTITDVTVTASLILIKGATINCEITVNGEPYGLPQVPVGDPGGLPLRLRHGREVLYLAPGRRLSTDLVLLRGSTEAPKEVNVWKIVTIIG